MSARKVGSSPALVLASRLILLAAATLLAIAGFALTRHDGKASESAAHYACPMHPQVTAKAPGTCPICRMALEPVRGPKKPEPKAPPPIAPEVAKRAVIPASTSKYGPGVTWLPEAYPPTAAEQPEKSGPVVGSPRRQVFSSAVRAAGWLETPERLAAVLYRDELNRLSPGEQGTFFRALAPREPIDVRLSDEPPAPWDASTALVHLVVVPRSAGKTGAQRTADAVQTLRSGDVGWLELPPKSRELLVFPESALLRSKAGPYVLVPSADAHAFTRQPVQIGRILDGQVVVLSGLTEDDKIVIGNAFFLDAEQGLEPVAEPIAGVAP